MRRDDYGYHYSYSVVGCNDYAFEALTTSGNCDIRVLCEENGFVFILGLEYNSKHNFGTSAGTRGAFSFYDYQDFCNFSFTTITTMKFFFQKIFGTFTTFTTFRGKTRDFVLKK